MQQVISVVLNAVPWILVALLVWFVLDRARRSHTQPGATPSKWGWGPAKGTGKHIVRTPFYLIGAAGWALATVAALIIAMFVVVGVIPWMWGTFVTGEAQAETRDYEPVERRLPWKRDAIEEFHWDFGARMNEWQVRPLAAPQSIAYLLAPLGVGQDGPRIPTGFQSAFLEGYGVEVTNTFPPGNYTAWITGYSGERGFVNNSYQVLSITPGGASWELQAKVMYPRTPPTTQFHWKARIPEGRLPFVRIASFRTDLPGGAQVLWGPSPDPHYRWAALVEFKGPDGLTLPAHEVQNQPGGMVIKGEERVFTDSLSKPVNTIFSSQVGDLQGSLFITVPKLSKPVTVDVVLAIYPPEHR